MWKLPEEDDDADKEQPKVNKSFSPEIELEHAGQVTCVAFSQDGFRLATGDSGTWRQVRGGLRHFSPLQTSSFVMPYKTAAQQLVVLVAPMLRALFLLNPPALLLRCLIKCRHLANDHLPSDTLLSLSLRQNIAIRVWDAYGTSEDDPYTPDWATAGLFLALEGHKKEVTSVSFSEDEKRLVSVSRVR